MEAARDEWGAQLMVAGREATEAWARPRIRTTDGGGPGQRGRGRGGYAHLTVAGRDEDDGGDSRNGQRPPGTMEVWTSDSHN